ncbi:hypothetical protein SAY86_028090 [Trapa natans]|uniref:PPC domain-containing protein n=1 Tax=Trapa natans TaxID=22666 RepID=A0AAN7M1Q4_TRANT|nr:hypothetical protein SAY86_028090 [Trapa natans]
MKRNYLELKGEEAAAGPMLSKIHYPAQQQQQQLHSFSHHFQLASGDHHASEDDTSAATSRPSPPSSTTPDNPRPRPEASSAGDGATIEVIRRPRGRPPGSKNKPKFPVFITGEPEPVMSPYILEIPGGADIVEAISRFCRRKGIGLCVLTGTGTVANFTLLQPSAANVPTGSTVTFHGRFEILSISAIFLQQNPSILAPNSFKISLAGPQGQIVGGHVAGPLVAAGPVFVVASSFNNPSYHRLMEEHDDSRKSTADGHSPPVSAGVDSPGNHSLGHQLQQGADSGRLPTMYSCHMPTESMWVPPSKQQQQHHHY